MTDSSPALQEALTLLGGAGTWHELRRSLQERKLDQALTPEETHRLMDAWNARLTATLSDDALLEELRFWADGGTFEDHLAGFHAIPPAALLDAATTRGWFVRRLPSGAVVNPPEHKPITLKTLDVVAR